MKAPLNRRGAGFAALIALLSIAPASFAQTLSITTTSFPNGAVALPYAANAFVVGGTPPYSWSITAPALPDGLSLNPATGAIAGTPTAIGSFSFTLTVSDTSAAPQSASQTLTITIAGPEAPSFVEYPVPTSVSSPAGITAGSDGALWFTENTGNKIGRIMITAGTATPTEYSVPTLNAGPWGITAGPDGALWFAELLASNLGRIATDGTIQEFATPSPASGPFGIVTGPDGALWFTESVAVPGNDFLNGIGRITTPPPPAFSEFTLPISSSSPYGITSGPDGSLWFTQFAANGVAQITTAGTVTEFPLRSLNSAPYGIATGSDGALWFTQAGTSAPVPSGNQIGRISTTGVVAEFPIPTLNSAPHGITAASDGALWFVENNGNNIGRISTAGVITEYPIPTPTSTPEGIAAVPDGSLWFTEASATANRIGHLSLIPQLQVSNGALPNGTVGVPFSATLVAQGGTAPFTWSIAGALPSGLAFSPSTGPTAAITGTPMTAGPYSFAVQLADSTVPGETATQMFTVNIVSGLTLVTPTALPSATAGTAYSYQLVGQGGTAPYAWSVVSGALPPGLTLTASTGALTGTPAVAGPFSFTTQTVDASSHMVQTIFTLVVNPAARRTAPSIALTGLQPNVTPTEPSQPISFGAALSAPLIADMSATVSLSFTPNATGVSNGYMDPALQLVNAQGQSGTSVSVTIPATSTSISQIAQLKPGTVAGQITVTLSVPGQILAAYTVTVPRQAPVIETHKVQIVFTAAGFDVEILDANSTPRDLKTIAFTFTAAAGAQITGTATFSEDISSALAQWYASQPGLKNGSAFSLTVPFTFTGDSNAIQSVSVTLTNSVGTSAAVTGTP